jgi:hypothetical protein
MKKPNQLSYEELRQVVQGVLEALYPDADPDAKWSPDTLEDVAAVLAMAGLTPGDDTGK